ncbi:3-deoxy-7-phosphoheptulonate synthase, partial [Streptococcus mutans]|nr:3-deoxy-7-phosphoheptulonate synthase [Streptococcus mutans]
MSFKATSDKINIEEMQSLSKLTGEALAQKEARDRELVSIIKGEDNRLLLIIGPCSSDNEEAVLEYA